MKVNILLKVQLKQIKLFSLTEIGKCMSPYRIYFEGKKKKAICYQDAGSMNPIWSALVRLMRFKLINMNLTIPKHTEDIWPRNLSYFLLVLIFPTALGFSERVFRQKKEW